MYQIREVDAALREAVEEARQAVQHGVVGRFRDSELADYVAMVGAVSVVVGWLVGWSAGR